MKLTDNLGASIFLPISLHRIISPNKKSHQNVLEMIFGKFVNI